MKIIKPNLRNRISDEFLNDTVITYFEDDLFETVSNDDIVYQFQNMKFGEDNCLDYISFVISFL